MLTTRETAEKLGLSIATVRRLAKLGVLKPSRLTSGSHMRFSVSEIDEISEGRSMGVCKERGWWFAHFKAKALTGEIIRVHRKAVQNTRRSAEILERAIRAQIASGEWGRSHSTVANFSPDYIKHLQLAGRKPSYINDAKYCLRLIKKTLGGLDLVAVGPAEIDRLKGALTVSHKTANNVLGHLHNMLRLALEYGMVRAVPSARLYKVPPPQDADYRWLPGEEAATLIDACPDNLRAMVIVALNTGLRLGELEALRWSDVSGESITVRQTWCQVSREFVTPKSGRQRVVPLNTVAREALGHVPRKLGCDLIWSTKSGRVIDKPDLSRSLNKACARAGIDPIGWHVLRHTFASWLVSSGVALYEAQKLLGHSTPLMTQRYAHLAPDRLRSAVESIEGLLVPQRSRRDRQTREIVVAVGGEWRPQPDSKSDAKAT